MSVAATSPPYRQRRRNLPGRARQRDQNDYPMFSRPMSSKESLDELGGAASEDTSRGY
jgi:hypothetical protein